jgi:hypothetical protein
MANGQHNISKGRKIAGWIFIGFVGAIFIMTATMKLSHSKEVIAGFLKYGLAGKETLIGTGELISVLLFIFPRTSSLGVLLLSALLGGAIATHMAHGEMYFPVAILLILMWFANWLRNPEMFASFTKK